MVKVYWPLSMQQRDIAVFEWLFKNIPKVDGHLAWYYLERDNSLVFEYEEDATAFRLRFIL